MLLMRWFRPGNWKEIRAFAEFNFDVSLGMKREVRKGSRLSRAITESAPVASIVSVRRCTRLLFLFQLNFSQRLFRDDVIGLELKDLL